MLLLLFLLAPAFSQAAGSCQWADGSFARVGKASWVREGRDSELYWGGEKTELTTYREFREMVAPLPYLADPRERLRNMLEAFKKVPGEPSREWAIITRNFTKIIQGGVGQLRDVSCIETLLMAEALARKPLPELPYELCAAVLRKNGSIRIYLLTGSRTSTSFEEVMPALRRDLKRGWKLALNLHSHPFFPGSDPANVGGYTAPSNADNLLYALWRKAYALEAAAVTNGIFSFQLPAADFSKLETF